MRVMTKLIADGVHLIDVDNTPLHRSLKSIICQIVSQLSILLVGGRRKGNLTHRAREPGDPGGEHSPGQPSTAEPG